MASEQLAELKQRLRSALVCIGKREKELQDEANAAGVTVEAFELDELEKRMSAALDEVRDRLALLRPKK
jgi:hypothetical protein